MLRNIETNLKQLLFSGSCGQLFSIMCSLKALFQNMSHRCERCGDSEPRMKNLPRKKSDAGGGNPLNVNPSRSNSSVCRIDWIKVLKKHSCDDGKKGYPWKEPLEHSRKHDAMVGLILDHSRMICVKKNRSGFSGNTTCPIPSFHRHMLSSL